MALTGLRGTSMPTPVVGYDAIAVVKEEHHLSVPIIGGQWPAVAKYDGLTLAPVLVIDLRSIFRCNRRHGYSPFVFKSARKLWTVCCFLMILPVCKYVERQHCPSLSKRPRITGRLVTREWWLQFRFSI